MEVSDPLKSKSRGSYKNYYLDFSRRLLTIELNQFLLHKMIILLLFSALDCAIVGIEMYLKQIPGFGHH